MKKLTLLFFACVIACALHAQDTTKKTKPVPPIKETYQFNGDKPITLSITFTVPSAMINNYIFTEQQGGVPTIVNSDKLSGKQINIIVASHQAVLDSLNIHLYKQFQKFVKDDQDKFTADTMAKYHVKLKKP